MKVESRTVVTRLIGAGFLIGLVIAMAVGSFRTGPKEVDVVKAKAALAKRWSRYGEIPRRSPGSRVTAPARQRQHLKQNDPPR
jgi:hypothetical protein